MGTGIPWRCRNGCRLPYYVPSLTDRHFPPLGRRALRALMLAANPDNLDAYQMALEIHFGLTRLEALLPDQAPVLLPTGQRLTTLLRAGLGTDGGSARWRGRHGSRCWWRSIPCARTRSISASMPWPWGRSRPRTISAVPFAGCTRLIPPTRTFFGRE